MNDFMPKLPLHPSLLVAFVSHLCCISTLTQSKFPRVTARCSGVLLCGSTFSESCYKRGYNEFALANQNISKQ